MTLKDIEKFLHDHNFQQWYRNDCWKKLGAADMDNYPTEQAYMYAKYETPHWRTSPERIEQFKEICNTIYPNFQDQDGITHLNIYSKGKTKLGQFLSNFTKHPIDTEDGKFNSIEGYWYFLGCGDEKLRTLSGWQAKQYGRDCKASDWNEDPDFKRKICEAIRTKIITSNFKPLFTNNNLDLDHYYVYGNKIVRPREGQWILDFLNELRNELKVQKNEEYKTKRTKELHDREYEQYLKLKAKFEK